MASGNEVRLEAMQQYRQALKAGQRCYRENVHRGRSPYPHVLEEQLRDMMVAGRVELGMLEIPIEQITGVYMAGRQTAFASNFMPILDIGTEFANKWVSLCEAHLGDMGIVDPIRCYEYMGRFYVQEGNKRVSVLKSFGAPSIRAYVTRIVPVYSDDPAVRVYYEFMHFYELCGLYQVQLRRVGDYPKLQAALGFDAEHVWTATEKRAFLTAFYTFRAAYEKLGPQVPNGAAEAFLIWLGVYSLGDLRILTPQALEKTLRAIRPELDAAQRGGPIAMQTDEPQTQSANLFGRITGWMGGTLQVAIVHECAPEDSPWVAAHEAGSQALARALEGEVTVRTYLATDYLGPEDAMEHAVADGAQVVFTTTVPLIFACRKLAAKHPGVRFLNCSIDMPYPGVRTYYGRIYEAKFLTGVLAGALTPDGRIGYVADGPIFGSTAAINAFALGAQMTNPRAAIALSWSCCEPEPIQALLAQGLTVISGRELPRAADAPYRGLFQMVDGQPVAMAVPVWNWDGFYIRLVRSILRGSWDALSASDAGKAVNYWWGLASGAVDVQLGQALPDGLRELTGILRGALIHGELAPFHRRIASQDGTQKNSGDRWFSPEEVLHMDWLCSNVCGQIPPYEALLPMARPIMRLQGLYRDRLQPEKRGPVL